MAKSQCGNCYHTHQSGTPCASCVIEIRTVANLFEHVTDDIMRRQRCAQIWTKSGSDDGYGFLARTPEHMEQALREHGFTK